MSIFENIALNMNISGNASGTQKGSGNFTNSKNEAIKDMSLKLLEVLSQGDTNMSLEIKAQVRDIMQNQLILTLPDASELSGRTESLLPLSIGDNASFRVTLNPEGQLTLSLISTEKAAKDSEINPDNPLVKKALSSAGIPANNRSLMVTSELLNAGQAVNSANLRKFITLSIKNPDIPIKELVLLDANKVPLTQSNLSAFRELSQGATVWDKEYAYKTISQQPYESPSPLFPAEKGYAEMPERILSPATAAAPEAQFQVNSMALSTQPATTALPEATATANPSAALFEASSSADLPEASASAELRNQSSDIAEVLRENPSPIPEQEISSSIDRPLVFSSPFTSPTEDKPPLPIEPKDFSEEAVKKFYSALKESGASANSSVRSVSPLPEASPAAQEKLLQEATEKTIQGNVQNASTADKLQFMQDINNVFPFIQIPVKLQEENAKGELYVFEKKKKYNPDEPLTAVLHLELDSLGTTDVKVSLFKNKVSAFFEVADKDAVKFFQDEMGSLTERLAKLGFTFDSDFKVKEPDSTEKPLLYQFLEAHTPKNYSRYTFDVHA